MAHHPARSLVVGRLPTALGWLLSVAALVACAASASSERYPEKKRPEPLRSASDGEIMGADEISPEDRLEASPTNEHAATRGPRAETSEAEEAHERLEYEECIEADQQALAANAGSGGAPGKKRRFCPPPPPQN